jgi:hypothetical protein
VKKPAVVVPDSQNVFILLGKRAARPGIPAEKGPGSRAVTKAGADKSGNKPGWIHNHWAPQVAWLEATQQAYKESLPDDEQDSCPELFPGKVSDNVKALHDMKATMKCKHCDHIRSFNPSTKFKKHLMHCSGFQESSEWDCDEVRTELALMGSKDKVRLQQTPYSRAVGQLQS